MKLIENVKATATRNPKDAIDSREEDSFVAHADRIASPAPAILKRTNRRQGIKTMAVVTNPMLAIPAAFALLALTQTAGECGFRLENHFVANHAQGMPTLPADAEVSNAPDGGPVLLRTGTGGQGESEKTPLSCLQIQAIDEVELINEPTPGADCD